MSRTLSDLSQLSRSMVKREVRFEAKKEEPAPITDADAEVLAYFSKGGTRDIVKKPSQPEKCDAGCITELEEKIAAQEAALVVLAAEKVAAEEKASRFEEDLLKSTEALGLARAEIVRLKGEVASLQQRAQEAAEKGVVYASEDVGVIAPTRPEKPVCGLLARDVGIEEMFEGELREMVVSALMESRDNAERSGCERRAALLGKLLAGNTLSGELDWRREQLWQILKDAGSFADSHTISALEKLGFKLISGKRHWKLEYGNVRIPLSKTPSDYRSNRNAANEIANKCF